jgi:hypothetical protein
MSIEIRREPGKDVTIFAIEGPVTLDEMAKVVDIFYAEDSTRHTLWDLSQSSLAGVRPNEVLKFIQKAAESGLEHGRDGRTAVFATSDLQYGLSRMAETYADFEKLPTSIALFRSLDDAMEWLLAE